MRKLFSILSSGLVKAVVLASYLLTLVLSGGVHFHLSFSHLHDESSLHHHRIVLHAHKSSADLDNWHELSGSPAHQHPVSSVQIIAVSHPSIKSKLSQAETKKQLDDAAFYTPIKHVSAHHTLLRPSLASQLSKLHLSSNLSGRSPPVA